MGLLDHAMTQHDGTCMTHCFRIALFILLALLLPGMLAAQNDPNKDRLRASEGDWYGKADMLVVYDSMSVDVQESGLSYVTMHKLVRVLTAKGALSLRNVIYDYDPLSADVEVRLVRIYRADGSVETVGKDRVHDYPAPARAIYWGARQKLVDVGRLEPGDAVETVAFRKGFTYALLGDGSDDDSRFIPPMKGHYYDIVEFWSSVPVTEKVYRIFTPADKPLQYEVYNGELTSYVHFHPQHTHRVKVAVNPAGKQAATTEDALHPTAGMVTKPGKITYGWYKRHILPLKTEPDMVAASDVAPKLLLSTSPDWYAKAVWFHGVNEDFGSFAVTPEVQKMTDNLLKGVTNEHEKISILNHWVAEEIRYSGISMGEGEGYTLHTGEMTFSDRCGVCKDKAGMLVTMLRAAGFESYPAMTMAGSRIDRIPADQFNHSVTTVKLSTGEWMLLDPTWIPGAREMWSSAEQQQEYLLGIPGGADVMSTPVSPADNHYWNATNTATLLADGTLEGTIVIEAEGQSDAMLRRAFSRSYRSSWEDNFVSQFLKKFPTAEAKVTEMTTVEDLSKPFAIRMNYRIPGYAIVDGKRLLLTPLLADSPFDDGFNAGELSINTSLETRKYGFRARCSKLVQLHEVITLPSGYSTETLPQTVEKGGAPASFSSVFSKEGNSIRMKATHRLEKRVYEAADWPDFRAALLARKDLANTSITLTR